MEVDGQILRRITECYSDPLLVVAYRTGCLVMNPTSSSSPRQEPVVESSVEPVIESSISAPMTEKQPLGESPVNQDLTVPPPAPMEITTNPAAKRYAQTRSG